jgi:hypothetical protein
MNTRLILKEEEVIALFAEHGKAPSPLVDALKRLVKSHEALRRRAERLDSLAAEARGVLDKMARSDP